MQFLLYLTFAILLIHHCQAKIYTKCEFVNALLQFGFPKDQIPVWSCIAAHESNYDTQAINHSSGDYGIMQISHLYWCNDGNTPGKGCKITCQSLLSDDIWEDLTCTKTVFEETQKLGRNGFSAWTTYGSCQGDNTQYVQGCL